MFTGLISDVGVIESVVTHGSLRRIRIASRYDAESVAIGASVACGGPCLTAVSVVSQVGGGAHIDVEVGAETLERTTAGSWRPGTRLNLERSLRIGDELGGHIVTGHIDSVADVLVVEPFDGMSRFSIRAPRRLAAFIAEKGSVSLDGTSLTVNRVMDDVFSILLIPHTLSVTTWGERRAGDVVNLEVDLMARYAARLAETSRAQGP